MDRPVGVVITAREIYDQVMALRSEIQQVKSTVVALTDVEHRLRAVERWRYALPLTGVTALLAAAAAIWGH